ncbi:Os03g0177966 [Oryza sativa Japonica Group]|uniref:Os03g0177966 protein n=1 Tax=Oryza sativa subsp. japonica TaxID=39947 RepID=A0A0P0VTU0_ORYSJ|nr:Os03g0177966 [Oryza sativa Japonica Group]
MYKQVLGSTIITKDRTLEIYLVAAADHLLHSKSESKKSVLTGLAILGDTSLKTTSGGVNDEHGTVSLGGTRDHVLDEVTVTRGIDDRAVVLGGLELPQGDINGDTSLTLGLELVEHPRVLEGPLVHLSGFLLEPLDHTLVDTSKLVDQMARGGRLAGVDVANDHNVDVRLLLTHG